jgi:hypothetical protein
MYPPPHMYWRLLDSGGVLDACMQARALMWLRVIVVQICTITMSVRNQPKNA